MKVQKLAVRAHGSCEAHKGVTQLHICNCSCSRSSSTEKRLPGHLWSVRKTKIEVINPLSIFQQVLYPSFFLKWIKWSPYLISRLRSTIKSSYRPNYNPWNATEMHYNILLFSLQKSLSVQVAERKCLVLFTICFKTLLYTNLILISMNNIFVNLLHIKHFIKAVTMNKITCLHLNDANHSEKRLHRTSVRVVDT